MEIKGKDQAFLLILSATFAPVSMYFIPLILENTNLLPHNEISKILPRIVFQILFILIAGILFYLLKKNINKEKTRRGIYSILVGIYSTFIYLIANLEHSFAFGLKNVLVYTTIGFNAIIFIFLTLYLFKRKYSSGPKTLLFFIPLIIINLLKVIFFPSCCDFVVDLSVVLLQLFFMISLLNK